MRIYRITLGKLKMWQTRLSTYTALVNFVMVFYLFIVENDWFEWYVWLILVVSLVLFIVWFDTVKVMPDQLAYSFVKNPEWVEHVKRQKKIIEQQDEILKKIGGKVDGLRIDE